MSPTLTQVIRSKTLNTCSVCALNKKERTMKKRKFYDYNDVNRISVVKFLSTHNKEKGDKGFKFLCFFNNQIFLQPLYVIVC